MINIRATQASRFQHLCSTAIVAGLTACGGGASSSEQATSATSPIAAPAPAPTAGSYPHYPALNLNDIPWHTAAGGWGPQVRLEAPALPVTTRSVTVHSQAAFNTEAAVNGTQITIGTGWAPNTLVFVAASDIDIIIPPGIVIGAISVGTYSPQTPYARIRIRGPVPGTHSGGRMGQYREWHNQISDIVIDGIDLNGDSSFTGSEGLIAFRVGATRMAVLNSRVISSDATWLGNAKHVVIANSNFYHAASTRAQNGLNGGYGIRNGSGPFTIIDSRVQGTRYHNIRVHSHGNTGELLYIGRSTIVAMAEGRTALLWNLANLNDNLGRGQGAIVEGNSIYSYAAPGCLFGSEINSNNVTWSRVANNRFYGGGNAVFNSVSANGGGTEGNTFAALGNFPAWGGPGDPRQVPQPNGLPVITGEGQCPGP